MTSISAEPCGAPNCSNTRANRRDLSFFRFPRDRERCLQWLRNGGLTELIGQNPLKLYNKYKLCGEHFVNECFLNCNSRNRLVPSAVPTIFASENQTSAFQISNLLNEDDTSVSDGPGLENASVFRVKSEPLEIIETEEEARTETNSVDNGTEPAVIVKNEEAASILLQNETPCPVAETRSSNSEREILNLKRLLEINNFEHEEKLKKIRLSLKRETSRAETAENKARRLTVELKQDVIEKHFSNLPENGKMFLKMQQRLNSQDKDAKGGKTYTPAEKRTCLELYYLGPRSYEALGEMFFLPKPRTLRRWLKKVAVEPGIHSRLQQLLRETPEDASEEVSVLSFDETSLDELLP